MFLGTSRTAWGLAAICLVTTCVDPDRLAAQDAPLWTNNTLSISAGRFWSLPPSVRTTSGPDREARFIRFRQWNFGLAYEHYMLKGWSLGARLDVTQPYFGAEGQVDDPAHGNPPGSSTARLTGLKRINAVFIFMECMATAGLPVKVARRWRLDAALELGINPGVGSSAGTSFGHTALTDTGRIYVFSAGLGVRDADWWPMFGIELKGTYRLANHDRLTVALEGRLSGTHYWEGYYTTYDEGPSPSTGTFSGHLAYIGFRMGYAFTWGPPRKPKWMRRQEAAGRPGPGE